MNKTDCDSFWQSDLAALLAQLSIENAVICGRLLCQYHTVKVGATPGYHITVASDAHTMADRTFVTTGQLINQHNEVWAVY